MTLPKHADYEEAIYSRMTGSVTATLLLLPVVLVVYVWLVNFSLLHPLAWVYNSLSLLLSASLWLEAAILAVIVAAVSVTSWKHFTVSPVVRTSRLSQLVHALRPERWLHCLGHGLAGGVSSWLLTGVLGEGYQGLVQRCTHDRESACMNEHHVFAVCYGVYVGVVYSFSFHHDNVFHVVFPKVTQPRYFRVKNSVVPTLSENLWTTVSQIRWFYLAYWLLGGCFTGWICASLNLHYSPVRLTSLYGLLDVSLLWCAVLTGMCIRLPWIAGVSLYNIFITMPFHFPVETVLEGKTSLVEAMASREQAATPREQLMAHHGFSSLYYVAQFSPGQRQRLFSLSQPGGHPHNWSGVVTECLRALKELTHEINAYNDGSPIMKNGNTEAYQKGSNGTTLTYRGAHVPETIPYSHRDDVTAPNVPPYVRDDVMNAGTSYGVRGDVNAVQSVTLFDKMWSDLKKKPGVAYFVCDLPELQSRRLFSACQNQIWALEDPLPPSALSLLIRCSVQEDEFGVVQKHVPDILTTVLALQEAVERHAKLGLNGRGRAASGRRQDVDSALRTGLRQSLKTAVYRVTETFGKHVCDLNLPYEQQRRLESFLDYKE